MNGVNRLFRFVAPVALIAVSAPAVLAQAISYAVFPEGRAFKVTMVVKNVKEPTVKFQIPTWSPGAYILGNYAANIADVTAETAPGKIVEVTHPDKLTWEAATGGAKQVLFHYTVNNSDVQSVDGKLKRAHLSGPRTYMYVVGRKQEPVALTLLAPGGWKIATSLDPKGEPSSTSTSVEERFTAPSYDVLADAPVEMGDFAEDDFEVKGTPYRIVLYGDYSNVDRAKLKDYCTRVAETETSFFHDTPFKRYVFEFRCSPQGRGSGGLEHLGSTEISIMGPVFDVTRSVIAHEFFHLWNVKRIRPAVLGPFDYTQAVRTRNLWWSEGVTSYYGDLLSRRGGLNTPDEYLKHLGQTIGELQGNPARLQVTADDSSYKVWDGGGSQGFGRLSYYTKGELMGLCFDLRIRHETGNKKSLDDVIKSLYQQCSRGNGPGFGEDAIKETINKVAGKDLSAFYDQLARSTQEMPFDECLAYAGLKLGTGNIVTSPDLGMINMPDREAGGLRVFVATAGGAAARAGLKEQDLITQVDGKPVAIGFGGAPQPNAVNLRTLKAGDKVKLTVLRDGQKQDLDYTVGTRESREMVVTMESSATPAQLAIRKGWLGL